MRKSVANGAACRIGDEVDEVGWTPVDRDRKSRRLRKGTLNHGLIIGGQQAFGTIVAHAMGREVAFEKRTRAGN